MCSAYIDMQREHSHFNNEACRSSSRTHTTDMRKEQLTNTGSGNRIPSYTGSGNGIPHTLGLGMGPTLEKCLEDISERMP